jgi:hypothetical protein
MDARHAELSKAQLQPTEVEEEELSGPEFRAHVDRRKNPMPVRSSAFLSQSLRSTY